MNDCHQHDSSPSPFLVENMGLLPKGSALDVAMGKGRHSVYLAKQGYDVTGIDISPESVAAALEKAAQAGVTVRGIVADLEHGYVLPRDKYDIVVCFNYLHRPLIPSIRQAVHPGGVVVYETFTAVQAQFGRPSNPDFLLEKDELLVLFRGFQVLMYYEGILSPRKATAGIIAQRPPG